ncbi:NAD-dependent epimerase/dehydratase family protein [Nocardioides euryhalodurans]|uniref:NAD-dependent epimerase/dehydratase family protein n=1 Tax=Nocardioides euryhalodurans TaxID=2518370 RepID=A0A4P7GGP4_9ACTN|nr:NAD-dependent epimerase/dehydratase family protein [Nocardioides euryhalodurans]QBR91005.1 NAD-dependent epimerase/dehydratase family protein [Nocardioides euryhalodurans]
MRLLVLGGTHHVGRAVVETALDRGHDVVTLNRGVSGVTSPDVDARHADRLDPEAMASALGDDSFDAVVDTWSSGPVAVRDAARLLSGRAGHYTYVSSRSVYTWPPAMGTDESAPVVEADPSSTDAVDYAAAKRGGELATEEFDGPVALLRAGLILGPYEIVGRLPFWLTRIRRGGRVPAPGPRERPLQLIDARDLAAWVVDHRPVGTFNTVSRSGHATIGDVLEACVDATGADADLVWLAPEVVEASGVQPWTELPIWVPPTGEYAALHDCDVSAAEAAGLRCRPVTETVTDTWAWLQREGLPAQPADRPATGMDAAAEQRLWEAASGLG